MRPFTILVVLTLCGAGTARGVPRAAGAETTGATSLLTAERRARDAAERLRLPESRPARWKPGGGGWTPAWTVERERPRTAPRD